MVGLVIRNDQRLQEHDILFQVRLAMHLSDLSTEAKIHLDILLFAYLYLPFCKIALYIMSSQMRNLKNQKMYLSLYFTTSYIISYNCGLRLRLSPNMVFRRRAARDGAAEGDWTDITDTHGPII
jgi:hypothetical protein